MLLPNRKKNSKNVLEKKRELRANLDGAPAVSPSVRSIVIGAPHIAVSHHAAQTEGECLAHDANHKEEGKHSWVAQLGARGEHE